jgi:purine-binding chemotaxis protein CheW
MTGADQLLTFLVAGDEYAVSVLNVREVVACGPITKVPSLPPFVEGAANLRGTIVPVVNLAVKLGLPSAPLTRWSCLLIARVEVSGEPTLLGVLVEEVRRLIDADAAAIEPPPPFGTRVHPSYLRGFVRDGERWVLVLDLARVLSTEELLALGASTPILPEGT